MPKRNLFGGGVGGSWWCGVLGVWCGVVWCDVVLCWCDGMRLGDVMLVRSCEGMRFCPVVVDMPTVRRWCTEMKFTPAWKLLCLNLQTLPATNKQSMRWHPTKSHQLLLRTMKNYSTTAQHKKLQNIEPRDRILQAFTAYCFVKK